MAKKKSNKVATILYIFLLIILVAAIAAVAVYIVKPTDTPITSTQSSQTDGTGSSGSSNISGSNGSVGSASEGNGSSGDISGDNSQTEGSVLLYRRNSRTSPTFLTTLYYADENTTWGEWVRSGYNTMGFYVTSYGSVAIGSEDEEDETESWYYDLFYLDENSAYHILSSTEKVSAYESVYEGIVYG